MVDRDVIVEKVGSIQQSMKRIKTVTKFDPGTLDNIDTQDIFVINLQRAIQSAIDMAAHIVADEGLGMPENLKDNFVLLQKGGIISKDDAAKMTRMVGFGNIAVHEYQSLDTDVLKSILTKHLPDIEAFYISIVRHFKIQAE